jgi:NHL repeat
MKFCSYITAIFVLLVSSCGGSTSSTSSQYLTGITYDTTSGKLIVLDFGLNIVQSVSALTGSATLTTLAGSSGSSGTTNSTGTSSKFNGLQGVASDSSGNLFVSDLYNEVVRKITSPSSTATVTTFAGVMSTSGSIDGTTTAAYFYYPRGIAIDSSDNIYLADSANHTIRSITSAGVVSTLAGYAGTSGYTNGTSSSARFNYPNSVATDGTYVFVADTQNHQIRKIVISSGVVTLLAGNSSGTSGYTNSTTGTSAYFYYPVGIATDGTNLYVTDYYNHSIRKIVISSGVVTTLAGNTSGTSGYVNATGTSAYFSYPLGITYYNGNLYVTDQSGTHIRIVSTTDGATTTLY